MKQLPIFLCILITTFYAYSCDSLDKKNISYNQDLALFLSESKDKKSLIIFLEDTSREMEKGFIQNIQKQIDKNETHINIINLTDLPELDWIEEWIPNIYYPLICIFNENSELTDCIEGHSYERIEYAKLVLNESNVTKTNNYFSCNLETSRDSLIKGLNWSLQAQIAPANSAAIDSSLHYLSYPFNWHLRLKEVEKKGGKKEQILHIAKEILTCKSKETITPYCSIFREAQLIIDPSFCSPRIQVPDTIKLGTCRIGEEQKIDLKVRNYDRSPIHIYDIRTSCSCLEYQGDLRSYLINPQQNINLPFSFIAEEKGELFRIISILSDADPIDTEIIITATIY